jgi:2,4-dienoyl-CoA reductase-like NADH-dependent reductase (Old Yellow Enzyme family)
MPSLTSPLNIRSLHLKNRLVFPPMRSRKAALDGYVSDDIIKHYADRAEGPGLVIIEHAYISDNGRVSPQLGINDDKFIPGLSRLVDAVHAKGAAIILQINHTGSVSTKEIIGQQPVAPSPIKQPKRAGAEVPRALTTNEIRDIIDDFALAAVRAQQAGFDGVELHNAHGFLLSQFCSPHTNHRADEYGGSVANRIRLSVQAAQAIRKKIGNRYPLFCRFGAMDLLPEGLTLNEGIEMAHYLVEAGIDVLDVSSSMGGAIPQTVQGEGFFIPQAEAIRTAVETPVVGVGGIVTPQYANRVIEAARVDLVAVGRAIWDNPRWAIDAFKTLAQ